MSFCIVAIFLSARQLARQRVKFSLQESTVESKNMIFSESALWAESVLELQCFCVVCRAIFLKRIFIPINKGQRSNRSIAKRFPKHVMT